MTTKTEDTTYWTSCTVLLVVALILTYAIWISKPSRPLTESPDNPIHHIPQTPRKGLLG